MSHNNFTHAGHSAHSATKMWEKAADTPGAKGAAMDAGAGVMTAMAVAALVSAPVTVPIVVVGAGIGLAVRGLRWFFD